MVVLPLIFYETGPWLHSIVRDVYSFLLVEMRTRSALDIDCSYGLIPGVPDNSGADSRTLLSPVNLPQQSRGATPSSPMDLDTDWDIPDNADMYIAFATSPGKLRISFSGRPLP